MTISKFSIQVATLLKALRLKNNISIKELSKKSGVSVYKIKSMENFKHDIRFSTVFCLCEALNISMHDFAEMLE